MSGHCLDLPVLCCDDDVIIVAAHRQTNVSRMLSVMTSFGLSKFGNERHWCWCVFFSSTSRAASARSCSTCTNKHSPHSDNSHGVNWSRWDVTVQDHVPSFARVENNVKRCRMTHSRVHSKAKGNITASPEIFSLSTHCNKVWSRCLMGLTWQTWPNSPYTWLFQLKLNFNNKLTLQSSRSIIIVSSTKRPSWYESLYLLLLKASKH